MLMLCLESELVLLWILVNESGRLDKAVGREFVRVSSMLLRVLWLVVMMVVLLLLLL